MPAKPNCSNCKIMQGVAELIPQVKQIKPLSDTFAPSGFARKHHVELVRSLCTNAKEIGEKLPTECPNCPMGDPKICYCGLNARLEIWKAGDKIAEPILEQWRKQRKRK